MDLAQQKKNPNPLTDKLTRIRMVYSIAAAEIILLIAFIFWQPIYIRLTKGVWQRFGMHMPWTLSLDVHVTCAMIFFILITTQIILGLSQRRGNIANKIHPVLGKITLSFAPIFLAAAGWNVYARMNLEGQFDILPFTLFIATIIFIALFLLRGYLAIRKKNYLLHVDSMMGAFVLTAVAATVRFIMLIFYLIYHRLPETTDGFLLISSLALIANLALFYLLAGRIRQNIITILAMTTTVILIYSIFPWHYYAP